MQRTKENGTVIDVSEQFIDGLDQTINYNGDGTVNYINATDGTTTWRQTMTYTSGSLTGISKWVKQ